VSSGTGSAGAGSMAEKAKEKGKGKAKTARPGGGGKEKEKAQSVLQRFGEASASATLHKAFSPEHKGVAAELQEHGKKLLCRGGYCSALLDMPCTKVANGTHIVEFEVHEAGGGINFTVERTRAASKETLLEALLPRLQRMSRAGTTLVECKSGYGLDTETEVKMLRVLEAARETAPVEISSTFCGAHSVPRGKTSSEATEEVINEMLPEIQRLRNSGHLQVDSMDVFCEKGVFSVEETRRMLEAGKEQGLLLNFHGEELHRLNSAEMGAALGATAISHLEHVSPAGIRAMAAAGTVAVILPTTAYILRLEAPPVRDMIAGGVPVALGTDFNPNAYCLSMPLVMHLACVNLRMTMSEALSAATINAAASLGRARTHGSLEVGKQADLLLLDAPSWKHLIYQFGEASHIISHVIRGGRVVHSRPLAGSPQF